MFKVESDKAKNFLAISFSGKVGPEEAERSAKEVERHISDVRPGFSLLTDLSGLQEMDVACAPFLRLSMDLFSKHGIGKVIRIIPDPSKDIGLTIMSRFHYPHDIPIVTYATVAEAMSEMPD
jgi:hypothetical protein